MITIDLRGKTAAVVGGRSGIGLATAYRLAEAGARVVTLSRRADAPKLECPPGTAERIIHMQLDITNSAETAKVFAELASSNGLDIAVHSAGVLAPGSALDTEDELWRRHMATNADGLFFGTRESLRHIRAGGRGGKVVIVGSVSGQVGNPGFAAYCASKGLLVNLTRQMALDYASEGININSILPGFTNTEMTSIYDSGTKEAIADTIPAKAWATPEQIANAVLFLCSPLADYVHGVNLAVDGGYLAGRPA
ncbi:SDR family NAD(P)-dependent oxidoreductase [Pseudonocardia asaccharolytica]|uniref:3-oxoacyl-ACP reductase n=1 Tax=Pseudonocardia asaccharolytica DSM 44247 = NBRC 16224 TaxID=1123024 RepID=A0A511D609_9PSEU|nr:SDR family oxidoreductase [Pseudonocardia asaccharolytica]GEL20215.1 3-oxoacyl-ACP reductase [Pseudonocardia asaccharolytica DSM 44247 = NBRC 16224]